MTGLLRRAKARHADGDAGFTMIEVVISLLIIAIVTTGSVSFFLNNFRSANGQDQRQTAVNLANQQLEAIQSLPVNKLVSGRTSAMVTALYATSAATRLKISSQDDTSSTANWDPTAASDPLTVKTQPSATNVVVNGITYGFYNFIDTCWLTASTGVCGPTSGATTTQEYRVSVDVTWQSGGQCLNGCDYSTSTLIDPTGNPQFNSNISTPGGDYTSIGGNTNVGLSPTIGAMTQLTDSCTINGTSFTGTKIVVNGTGFKSGIRVWISGGGGTIPTTSVYQPIAGEVDFCLQSAEVPGAYTISVINPDGGHFQLPITVVPTLTAASGWDPTNKQLTLTGTGLESGAVFTATNGATFSTPTNTSYGNTTTTDSVVLPNYVGTKDSNTTTITVTNPDASTATFTIGSPYVTSMSPVTFVSGRTTTASLGGTGFKSGMTAVVTNGNGTATITAVTSSSSATMSATPTTAGTQNIYLYNTNGGYTSTGSVTVLAPAPTVTSFSPAEVTEDVLSGTITVNGTNFQSGVTASTSNGTVSSVTFVNSTKVTLKATPANSGNDVITLRNPDGQTTTFTLIVPNITSFTPNPPVHSTATTWTLNGAGFESGATITMKENGSTLTVSSVSFVNSTKYTFRATTTFTTSTVPFVVTLKNPDGSTDTLTQSMRPS